nr:retrovirus-related Pol polyprotein from transposon TNT 1-94 [Tanacetum cinerariifolium]
MLPSESKDCQSNIDAARLKLKLFKNITAAEDITKAKDPFSKGPLKVVSEPSWRNFVKSLSKKSYCLVITDDCSKFSWVFFLASKDETPSVLKTFIIGLENLLSLKVKIIRCDNGTEFKNSDLNQFCGVKGIRREFSIPRTPQQNGIAERKNRTLIEAARTLLADSLLPIPFWAEAVNTACYIQNRVLVTKPYNKTPYELLHGRLSSIGFMRPFGCLVTILNTLDPLGKFQGKVDEGFLVGYSVCSKAFRVFNSRTRIVQETLHVNFMENKPNVAGFQDTEKAGEEGTQTYVIFPVLSDGSTNCQNNNKDAHADGKEHDDDIQKSVSPDIHSTSIGAQTRKQGNKTENKDKELLQFKMQKVWILVYLPYGKRAIGTKWVYRNKKDERGIVIKNKARLVAQGHTQEEGINYEEVFAPVARIEAIRLFLAYASFMGFPVYQMDVKSEFLYGTIEEEVYVCQPPRFEDPKNPDKVYKVVKALYGLHQALRACQDKYVAEILRKFRLSEGKSASTPIDAEKPLLKDSDVKRIFRYLKEKPYLGLWYPKDSPFDLVSYLDSDYAGASLDRKSTTGGCQFLRCRLISWQCKKQTVVATSSTEAEYVGCYLRNVVIEIDALSDDLSITTNGIQLTMSNPQERVDSP